MLTCTGFVTAAVINKFWGKGHNKLAYVRFYCEKQTEKWALEATAANRQLSEDAASQQWISFKVEQVLRSSTNNKLPDRHAF